MHRILMAIALALALGGFAISVDSESAVANNVNDATTFIAATGQPDGLAKVEAANVNLGSDNVRAAHGLVAVTDSTTNVGREVATGMHDTGSVLICPLITAGSTDSTVGTVATNGELLPVPIVATVGLLTVNDLARTYATTFGYDPAALAANQSGALHLARLSLGTNGNKLMYAGRPTTDTATALTGTS